MKFPWLNIANALGYQLVWFATLFSASKGNFWLGFISSLIFSSLMFCFGGKARQDSRIVVIGLVLGIAIDSMFAASGWIQYAMPWSVIGFAPLWIIALWLSFSFTLNHSMAFLRKNYAVAAVFGFIGGPLAYWCADRVFDVISYGTKTALVMLGLGICWGLVIPAIFYIDKRMSQFGKFDGATA
ncbi:MAG TPA: DUF2878 domain-containing protein [Arenimonas sp.]|nr:DUF2878 domain-containing protein [Arenimonas sp.]